MNRLNLARCVRNLRGVLISSLYSITFSTALLSSAFLAAPQVLAANLNTHTPININVASTAVLAHGLKGIGPSKAEAIVRYREEYGAFQTVDELVNVKGIGPKTLEKLRSQIVAGEFIEPKVGESLAEQETAAREAVQAVVKRSLEIRKAVDAHE